MKKTIKMISICAIISALTGCASIAGDNTRNVAVSSKPAGARIYVDNQQYGTTPAVITLPSYIYGGKNLTLKKTGYRDESMTVNTKFQPIAILDILLWPTFIVDGLTGDLVKIDPASRNMNITMTHA